MASPWQRPPTMSAASMPCANRASGGSCWRRRRGPGGIANGRGRAHSVCASPTPAFMVETRAQVRETHRSGARRRSVVIDCAAQSTVRRGRGEALYAAVPKNAFASRQQSVSNPVLAALMPAPSPRSLDRRALLHTRPGNAEQPVPVPDRHPFLHRLYRQPLLGPAAGAGLEDKAGARCACSP